MPDERRNRSLAGARYAARRSSPRDSDARIENREPEKLVVKQFLVEKVDRALLQGGVQIRLSIQRTEHDDRDFGKIDTEPVQQLEAEIGLVTEPDVEKDGGRAVGSNCLGDNAVVELIKELIKRGAEPDRRMSPDYRGKPFACQLSSLILRSQVIVDDQ